MDPQTLVKLTDKRYSKLLKITQNSTTNVNQIDLLTKISPN